MTEYKKIRVPSNGAKISLAGSKLQVPDNPIVVFIEGDGIGVDITPVMRKVVDAAVAKAYGGGRKIAWLEAYAGKKAVQIYGKDQWMPQETLEALKEYRVGIKGPLETPAGGGIRSLNVAIRQQLQLYACVRPVRYFAGVSSRLREPEQTDMVVFRENTEDIYLGVEFPAGSQEAKKLHDFLHDQLGVTKIPFPDSSGFGIKPVSRDGTRRLVRRALRYALDNKRRSVTLVHKGNIMKYTEGAFMQWGYELAAEEFGAIAIDDSAWHRIDRDGQEPLIIKDVIADNFLQKIILNTSEYDVIATMNLNGDYISDALAAQVGGIGIAPGANISEDYAVFEATHGTAPRHAGKDKVNPGSLILSADMMMRHMGWVEAGRLIEAGMARAIADGNVTYDLAKGRPDANMLSTSGFGEAICANIDKG